MTGNEFKNYAFTFLPYYICMGKAFILIPLLPPLPSPLQEDTVPHYTDNSLTQFRLLAAGQKSRQPVGETVVGV